MELKKGDLVVVVDDDYKYNIGEIGHLRYVENSGTKYPYTVDFLSGRADVVRLVVPATGLLKALL